MLQDVELVPEVEYFEASKADEEDGGDEEDEGSLVSLLWKLIGQPHINIRSSEEFVEGTFC